MAEVVENGRSGRKWQKWLIMTEVVDNDRSG